MNADLQRLIELQRLESVAHDAQRRISDEPERLRALEARLDIARQHVADAAADKLPANPAQCDGKLHREESDSDQRIVAFAGH